ncbi:MAG: hypothetical protein ABIQ31_05795 [Ferruginibacter sp.]
MRYLLLISMAFLFQSNIHAQKAWTNTQLTSAVKTLQASSIADKKSRDSLLNIHAISEKKSRDSAISINAAGEKKLREIAIKSISDSLAALYSRVNKIPIDSVIFTNGLYYDPLSKKVTAATGAFTYNDLFLIQEALKAIKLKVDNIK